MKISSLIVLFISLSFLGLAQVEENETDTTKIVLGGGNELILIKKTDSTQDTDSVKPKNVDDDFTYWSGVELGFTGISMTNQVKSDYEWFEIDNAKSVAVNLNVLEKKIPLIKHYLGINTGLGFTWQDYVFNDTLSIINMNGDSLIAMNADPIKFSKNKLKTGYLTIPLILEVNTSKTKSKNFHIAAGFIAGWNYRQLLKQQYELNGDKVKNKTKGDFNVNPWSLALTTRFGYGDFNIFANANVTSLFEEDQGPEAYPFTVGVTLAAF